MVESTSETANDQYFCDNCGTMVKQDQAMFEMTTEDYQAGYEFDSRVEDFQTILCPKCYQIHEEKTGRSSYGEPDIDISDHTTA